MKALTKNKPAKSEWPILNYTPAKTSQNNTKQAKTRPKTSQKKPKTSQIET